MNQPDSSFRGRRLPAGNPLANALVVVIGVLAIGLSLVIGFVAFIALAGLFLVMAAIVGIRLWWQGRRTGRRPRRRAGQPADGVIEGEFRVVSRQEPDERR